jgi:glyoxylase-like metal-dependent hydrolase (beta-lactamase superfamily II)
VRELQAGLWHWQAPHPEWTPDQRWPQEVSSYAIDDGGLLLLFDPLAVPGELLERAADRESVVVLTAPWHERDTRSLVEHLGVLVFTPPPDTADDLVRKYGISREQIPDGWHSPDVAWLLTGDGGEAHLYGAGDRLPIGIEAFPGRSHNDLVLWIESRRAVVAGDALVDFGRGFEIPPEVLQHGATREQVVEGLRPLLALPVELVLPAHGAPTDRAALERALS